MNITRPRSLLDYVQLATRYKWRAITVFVAVTAAAAMYAKFAPREYESEAKLFVRVGRENAGVDPTVRANETIGLNPSREIEMNSIVEHFRSRCLLEKVFATVEPQEQSATPRDRDRALRRLAKKVHVTSPRLSTVVNVKALAASPEKAQLIVATLVDVYLDEHMRINRATGSYEFFEEQLQRILDELAAAQAAVRDAKNAAGLASIEGRRRGLEEQISAVEKQIQNGIAELAATEAKIEALSSIIESSPETLLRQMVGGQPNDGLANMRQQLFQLQIQEQGALAEYTAAHPMTNTLRGQVAEVQQTLQSEKPKSDEIIRALTAKDAAGRASLVAQQEKLESQLSELNDRLIALNQDEITIEQKKREVKQLEERYVTYIGKLEEARMDRELLDERISNVSIIQTATLIPNHVRPQAVLILCLGVLAACLSSLGVILLSDLLGTAQ